MKQEQVERIKTVAKEQENNVPDPVIEQVVDGLVADIEEGVVPVNCSVEVDVTVIEGDPFEFSHTHEEPDGFTAHLTPEDAQQFDQMMIDLLAEFIMDMVNEMAEDTES